MTRAQVDTGVSVTNAAASGARQKPRGGGGRRQGPDLDTKTSTPPRCWQSGVKPKDQVAANVAAPAAVLDSSAQRGWGELPASVADVNSSAQKGWSELPAAERASRCSQLKEMGFSAREAQAALEQCSWDVNEALDRLFKGTVTVEPRTEEWFVQPSHTGGRSKTTSQAAACHSKVKPQPNSRNKHQGAPGVEKQTSPGRAVHSAAGDSTTASGLSTPRLPSKSPQQDLSPATSGDDLTTAFQSRPPLLPPGLGESSALLVAPPGLDLDDEPTPCLGTAATTELASSPPAFEVSAVVAPAPHPAAAAGAVSVVPKRRLQKVQHSWQCEEGMSDTQMSVDEECFVHVWSDSKTESGWVYAESLICCSRAGWLPESMLQPLPPGRRWMRVSTACKATFPMQMQVETGNLVLVDGSQDPVNGWVYAEQVGSATGRPSLQGLLGAGGWVPTQCIGWADV